TRWTSDFTYQAILDAIPEPGGARGLGLARIARNGGNGNILFLAGLADLGTGQVELHPAQHAPAAIYDTRKIARSLAEAETAQGHGFVIQQVNAQGTVVAEANLVLIRSEDGPSDAAQSFAQFVEPAADTAEVRIVQRGATAASLRVSASAPEVALQEPEVDAAAGLLRWAWTAADADGDALVFTVQYSHDDGATWETARLNVLETAVALDANLLPGSAAARLRVIASDGYHATVAQSSAFAVPRRPPSLTLNGLTAGAQLPYGTDPKLSAFALDLEDGRLSADAIAWTLTGPQSLTATGDTLNLQYLPPGSYHLEVNATDSDEQIGNATVDFSVLPFAIPELASAPELDGVPDEAVWDQALVIRWRDGNGVPVSARVFRAGGYVYAAFSDQPSSVLDTYPPSKAGLYVDVGGAGGTAPGSGVSGFFVDQTGRLSQTQGNGTALVDRPTPASAFEAVVNQAEYGWSAEMRIASALVGESGQPVRLAVFSTFTDGQGAHPLAWPIAATPEAPDTWVPALAAGTPPAPANLAPRAHAGGDQVLQAAEPRTIFLDGSASTDPEGAPLTYQWTQISGPPVTLSGADTAQASFTADPAAGEQAWTFALTVHDGALASTADEAAVRLLPLVLPVSVLEPGPTVMPRSDDVVEVRLPVGSLYDPGTAPPPGQRYRIETSVDLIRWTPLSESNPDVIGQLVFRDILAGEVKKFYRAVPAGIPGTPDPGQLLDFSQPGSVVQVTGDNPGNYFPFTVSAWVRTGDDSNAVGGIVSKYGDATGSSWATIVYEGRLRAFYIRNYGVNQVHVPPAGVDGGFIADGAWHHVAFVVDESGGILYVDGVATGVLPWTGAPGLAVSDWPVQIGRYQNFPNSFAGKIDEVTLWSAALNPYEVQALRQRGPLGTEAALEGWWKFDEGEGETAHDSSPKARDGVLLDGPAWGVSDAPIKR
ncbi:MAG: LamG domain-containing protein, partial [Verrucomicrobiae bacterium]|nr:LamG domain-containing protein [Verrucomicrobiae bacterium]